MMLALASVATTLALSTEVRAQGIGTGPTTDEIATLEQNLASEQAALSTTDCATACRALASIRRAADRICALDPDERCASARARADEATRRVRDACPECAIASAPPQPAPPMARPATKGVSPAAAEDAVLTAQSAPPSESKRGGCAGCTTSGTSPGDLGSGALALAALALAMRRRSKRSV